MIRIKEGVIQKQIIQYLSGRKDLFFHRCNNVGIYDHKTKGHRNPPPGFKKGFPDIVILKNGEFIGVELKGDEVYKRDGKVNKKGDYKKVQSEHQIEVEKQIKAAEGRYYVVRGLDELIEILGG